MYFPESSSLRILFKKGWMDIWIFLSGPIRLGYNMPHVPSAPTLDESIIILCLPHAFGCCSVLCSLLGQCTPGNRVDI